METALIGSSGACLQTNAFYLGCDEAENGKGTYVKPSLRWASFSRRLGGISVVVDSSSEGELCSMKVQARQLLVGADASPRDLTEILSPRYKHISPLGPVPGVPKSMHPFQ